MSRRKGELSESGIDRGWPHQVAVRASATKGAQHAAALEFCKNLSLAPRKHSFRRDDQDWNVWCFAEEAHAQAFQREFGGEFVTPKTRPRWPG